MGKHAYLIIAHNEFNLLKVLLKLIDDERNDIYIHIDKKVKVFNAQDITDVVENSNVYFTDRINVAWGGVSQIECDLLLLKAALKGNYDYYHLLSGQDLPIKNQDYIHSFFDKNKGKEFIGFDSSAFGFYDRIQYYHIFINKTGRSRTPIYLTLRIIEKLFIKIQKVLKINRTKKYNNIYQKGPGWFSITNDLAKYVVNKSEEIKKMYSYTSCSDEVFLQTLVVNSSFVNNLYNSRFDNNANATMRLIDWVRGKPYTFNKEDYNELINSNMLFARKFSMRTDSDIVNMIASYINN